MSVPTQGGGVTPQQKMAMLQQYISQSQFQTFLELANTTCFEQCISYPGESLSGGEKECLNSCVKKVMACWDTVNKRMSEKFQEQGQ